MKTFAPSLTKSFAAANPIPVEPPVMTATFPSNLPMVVTPVDVFSRRDHVNQTDDPATSRRTFPPRSTCATASLIEERGYTADTGTCTRPEAIIAAACLRAGGILAAYSGWPRKKPRRVIGLKITSSGLMEMGALLMAAKLTRVPPGESVDASTPVA